MIHTCDMCGYKLENDNYSLPFGWRFCTYGIGKSVHHKSFCSIECKKKFESLGGKVISEDDVP